MNLSDRVSEDVIKIFHNAKGSIFNDVIKWAQDLKQENKINDQIQESPDKQMGLCLTREIDKAKNHPILSEQSLSEYEQPKKDTAQ